MSLQAVVLSSCSWSSPWCASCQVGAAPNPAFPPIVFVDVRVKDGSGFSVILVQSEVGSEFGHWWSLPSCIMYIRRLKQHNLFILQVQGQLEHRWILVLYLNS